MADSQEIVDFGYETKAIHAGQEYDQWKNLEVVPPIVTSMTYYQHDPTNMQGYYYSRFGNPTRESLERCLSSLENSKHGLVYPSGCASITAVLQLLKHGDHVVSCGDQYGGTRAILVEYAEMQGLKIDFVDATDLYQFANAIKPNTKLIWLETPSNPLLKYTDLTAVCEVVRSRAGPDTLIAVDNTLLTSYFQRPLEFGVDIVMYSLTKYMNGHNDCLAGALLLNNTDVYKRLKTLQNKFGSTLSPFECYLANRGLKTLPLRMDKHCANAVAIAKFLETYPNVVKVFHPALPTHPQHELAKAQCSGYSGICSFQIKGGLDEAKKFVKSLRIFSTCTTLGSYGSYIMMSAFVSHVDVPKEVREKLGIFDSTLRLSVGLENADDLIKDLKQAFEQTYA